MDTPLPPADSLERDLRLGAYLDEELSPAERAAVERWLAEDAAAAARLAALRADREALRGLLGTVLQEPVPQRLVRTVVAPGWPAGLAGRAAAAVAIFALGMLAGALVVQHARPDDTAAAPPQSWVQRAALAHGVYVPEQRHPVEVRAQEEHLARWLTRRLDVPVRLFDLSRHGFVLMGGRLLPDDGQGPGAQLMYERPPGTRVTVYLRKAEANDEVAFRYERRDGLGLFYWIDGATGYALAGNLPREELLALARSIHQQCHAAGGPP
jgi:anti-sigma factor RsiW